MVPKVASLLRVRARDVNIAGWRSSGGRRRRLLLLDDLLDLVLTQNRVLETGLARDRRIVDRNAHALEEDVTDRIAVERRFGGVVTAPTRPGQEGVFLPRRIDRLDASIGSLNAIADLFLGSGKHDALVDIRSIE